MIFNGAVELWFEMLLLTLLQRILRWCRWEIGYFVESDCSFGGFIISSIYGHSEGRSGVRLTVTYSLFVMFRPISILGSVISNIVILSFMFSVIFFFLGRRIWRRVSWPIWINVRFVELLDGTCSNLYCWCITWGFSWLVKFDF